MNIRDWPERLSQDPREETWEAFKNGILQCEDVNELDDELRAALEKALEPWPGQLRVGFGSDFGVALKDPRALFFVRLCHEFKGVNGHVFVDQFLPFHKQFGMEDRRVSNLALYDGSDWFGEWNKLLGDSFLEEITDLYASQGFGGDALGAALCSPVLKNLKHFELRVQGYEAYCDLLGLSLDASIDKPELRTLAFSYYPLTPSLVPALGKASLPKLEAAFLTLVAGGGLGEVLEASWYSGLHTLQLSLEEDVEDNETGLEEWMAEHGQIPEGTQRLDRDIEMLANHPASAGLKRLSIFSEEGIVLTEKTFNALENAQSLKALEELWIWVPATLNLGTIQKRLEKSAALPNLKTLHLFDKDPKNAWPDWGLELYRHTTVDTPKK
ncbi:MAG: hypothetical protein P1V97_38440 [Planctomycetota bacterium]|nr:hypothetical protein [Planctomycetota bacterium]